MSGAAGESRKIRTAVVGTGEFGRNHAGYMASWRAQNLSAFTIEMQRERKPSLRSFKPKPCATSKRFASLRKLPA